MKLTRVLELFPNTTDGDWRQHDNGKGWVQITAFAAPTAYIAGIVSGNAWVIGNARVEANARVFCSHFQRRSKK